MRTRKRLLSLLLCGVLLFSLCSPSAFAEAQAAQDSGQITVNAGGLCEHHTEHTPDCGYTEGEPEIPCIHEHRSDCYTEVTECIHKHAPDCYPEETESSVSGNNATPSNAEEREPKKCDHVCNVESGCITKELDCNHEHNEDCGYSPAAEGTPCGYICKVCKASDSLLEGSSEENSSIGTSDTEKGNPELQKPVNMDDELELQTVPDLEKSSAAAATLIIGNVSTVETNPDLLGDGGSASYDADTNTLTLNDCRLPDGKIIFIDYQDETLTIELNGRNVIPYINVSSDRLSLRIKGNGSLEMENKDSHAIISNNGDIEISGGATIVAISSTDCGIFALGSIKISDGTVTAKGKGEGLRGDAGIVINDGSKVETGSTGKCALYTHLGNVEISGGATVIASSTANETNGIYTPEGKITISSSKVTADSYYPGLAGTQGVFIADGSDVTSVSSHDAAIYTPSAITISASKVNANGYSPSLFGNQGVFIADGSDVTAVSSNDCAIFSRAAVTISASKVNAEGYGVGLRGNGGVSIEDGSKVTTTAIASLGKAPSGIYSENDFVLNNSELYIESEDLGIFTQNKGTISGSWLQANNGVWAENKNQYTIADSVIIESGKGQVNGDAKLFQGANLRIGDTIDISQGASLTVEASGIKILGGSGGVTVGGNGELLLPPGTVLQKTDGAEGMEQIIGNGGGSISPDGRVEDWSSYKLILSVPAFEDAEYGYTPKAEAITITNTGDSNATISDITISGSAFTLNPGDKLVYTDRPNNTWTIQPKAGLNAGTYTGTLTVTYNGNATVTAEVKLTVNPLPAKYTVTVQTNGNGTASASPTSAAQGEKINLTASAGNGYHFKEWQVVSGGVIINGNSFTMPADNVTVKAIFEKDSDPTPPGPTEYTVTFDGNGGTTPAAQTTKNGKLTSQPVSTQSGYSFNGWYTAKTGGDKITLDTVFTASVTVYAQWTKNSSSGGSSGSSTTHYTLTFETNGGSAIEKVTGKSGKTIDLSGYLPTREGYDFNGWYSDKELTRKITEIELNGNKTVYAGWTERKTNPDTGAENPGTGTGNPFTDVKETDWFYKSVMFVYEKGLMAGTSATTFAPGSNATRAQLAVIFYRMEGSPKVEGKNSFTDVEYAPGTAWYYDAVTWAEQSGVVGGDGDDKFGPGDLITREQLAAVFYRYAQYKGYDVTATGSLDRFTDKDKVSEWAKQPLIWAVSSDIVNGTGDNLLSPQGTATRAQIAAMLHRFIDKYGLKPVATSTGTIWTNQTDKKSPLTGDNSTTGTADAESTGNAAEMADVSYSQKLTADVASPLTGSSGGISSWEITGLCALPAALLMGTAAVIIKRRRKMKAGTPA